MDRTLRSSLDVTGGLPIAGMRPTSLVSASETFISLYMTHWSDNRHPIDLRDRPSREVGNEVLLQCFVALCHCGLLSLINKVVTVLSNQTLDLLVHSVDWLVG